MTDSDRLDNFRAEDVLKSLHGFQRDAVEHAFERLYLAPDSTRRFLIADEVGLGKTLIARGILAKAIEWMRDTIDRIDIVYICSNQSIARQNIARLNPFKKLDFADAERITLLPMNLKDLVHNKVNLVAFTPGTSLDLKGGMGTARERLLMYRLLEEHWDLSGTRPINVLQGAVTKTERFRERARNFRSDYEVSEELEMAFRKRLDQEDRHLLKRTGPGLKERFEALCSQFSRSDAKVGKPAMDDRRQLIGELRMLLAQVCIDALEPDLVILDEFQRFKYLLDSTTEAGELARQLFEWSDANAVARVLMLSATPYKSYTLQHELDEDNHYEDFIRTVAFLEQDTERSIDLRDSLQQFRQQLYGLKESNGQELAKHRTVIEARLRKVISRTERLATERGANGMLKSIVTPNLQISSRDLDGYRFGQEVSDIVGVPNNIEYWKSAPYPLSFMEGYKVKQALRAHIDNVLSPGFGGSLDLNGAGALAANDIAAYRPLTVPNARMRHLLDDLEQQHAFQILWLPPSAPFYELGAPYRQAQEAGVAKRLVFSSWNLVPRSIAVLLSYESEQRAFNRDENAPSNTSEARKKRRGLLRFARSEGRLTGLPVLTLMYPSRSLAELCDPQAFVREQGLTDAKAAEVLHWAEARVRKRLGNAIQFAEPGHAADESWYWAAPLILERAEFEQAMDAWWTLDELPDIWSGAVFDDTEEATDKGWSDHVDAAAQVALGKRVPEGPAPADLPLTLALMGLAGPATCALRALLQLFPAEPNQGIAQREAAAQIGWGFRALFNRPESMAVVRRGNRQEAYWRLCLRHGMNGGLAAVMDEYLHVLRDACGFVAHEADVACPAIGEAALDALHVRAASLDLEEIHSDDSTRVSLRKHSMRSLFAMRFGSDRAAGKEQLQREHDVRAAFNSPFWPFVLATTSVGQEGLDFHWYCHAVVHWNLPSNPVELEQREGRVHRFKGHAIRKNIARRYLQEAVQQNTSDLWATMFALAAKGAVENGRGLVPYWLFALEDGAWIERHVPLFPLSRDSLRYTNLRRSLAAYRMVFGQPRQDELLEYLLMKLDTEQLAEYSDLARIDLAPPHYDA